MLSRVLVLLCALAALAKIVAPSESCEYYARKLGAPLEGWKFVSDTVSPSCIREPVNLGCAGEQYYDPVRIQVFNLTLYAADHINQRLPEFLNVVIHRALWCGRIKRRN
jgi:hypothetical protein